MGFSSSLRPSSHHCWVLSGGCWSLGRILPRSFSKKGLPRDCFDLTSPLSSIISPLEPPLFRPILSWNGIAGRYNFSYLTCLLRGWVGCVERRAGMRAEGRKAAGLCQRREDTDINKLRTHHLRHQLLSSRSQGGRGGGGGERKNVNDTFEPDLAWFRR
jgi:hypothetical protein